MIENKYYFCPDKDTRQWGSCSDVWNPCSQKLRKGMHHLKIKMR